MLTSCLRVVCVRVCVCVLCSPGRRPIDIPRGHRAVEAARSTAALATAQVVAHTAVATVAALPLLLLLRRMRRQRRSRCSNNMHSSVHHLQVAAQTARTTACELNQSSPHPRLLIRQQIVQVGIPKLIAAVATATRRLHRRALAVAHACSIRRRHAHRALRLIVAPPTSWPTWPTWPTWTTWTTRSARSAWSTWTAGTTRTTRSASAAAAGCHGVLACCHGAFQLYEARLVVVVLAVEVLADGDEVAQACSSGGDVAVVRWACRHTQPRGYGYSDSDSDSDSDSGSGSDSDSDAHSRLSGYCLWMASYSSSALVKLPMRR